MEHKDHPYEGTSGYMMTPSANALYSTTRWQDPEDVGNEIIVPTTAIPIPTKKPKKENCKQGITSWTPTATYAPPSEKYLREPSITHTILQELLTHSWRSKDLATSNHSQSSNASRDCIAHQAYKSYTRPYFAYTNQWIATNHLR